MIILLSPAKTMDFASAGPTELHSTPEFTKEAAYLAGEIRERSVVGLRDLLKVSAKLAYENHERFRLWNPDAGLPEAKQAILAYSGDAYRGLDAGNLSAEDLEWAQGHLRILSGMYGILRPLDLIMPYRLEFATKLGIQQYNDLYEYWDQKLESSLKKLKALEGNGILVNLASAGYYRAIDPEKPGFTVYTPVFKEYRNGEYRFLSVYGKKARGMMARFIIERRMEDPEEMKLFNSEGYYYNDSLSGDREWVFTR
jgi:uncharacterized protein